MSKKFQAQVQFGKTWVTLFTDPHYKNALDYLHKNSGERYPMRIVRVVTTVVFSEETKEKK